MRPIEFRGFSLSDKQWKYGYYYVNTLGMHNIVCPDGMTYEVDPASIGQYTGLRDRSSLMIYEGGIIQYKSHKGYLLPDHIGELIWKNVGYSISDPLGRTYDIDLWDADELEVDILDHCTIIGNTYEHPNLLQL